MIIDLHTQVWSSLEQLGPECARHVRARGGLSSRDFATRAERGRIDASPAAHDRAMDCVGLSVLVGFRSTLLGASIPTEYIAEVVSRDPARRVGVAGVDPLAPEDIGAQMDAAAALGMVGVAIAPMSQGFHPAHSTAMKIYERCVESAMPLFVRQQHPLTTTAVLEFGRPSAWDEIARAFPSLRIVLSQLGSPWIDETLTLLAKHDNIFADISGVASRPWQLYTALLNAMDLGVMDKLLFGSGFPFSAPADTIETLYTVNACCQGTQLPSIPRAAIRGIVERHSLGCLGVEVDHLVGGGSGEVSRISSDDQDRSEATAASTEVKPSEARAG